MPPMIALFTENICGSCGILIETCYLLCKGPTCRGGGRRICAECSCDDAKDECEKCREAREILTRPELLEK